MEKNFLCDILTAEKVHGDNWCVRSVRDRCGVGTLPRQETQHPDRLPLRNLRERSPAGVPHPEQNQTSHPVRNGKGEDRHRTRFHLGGYLGRSTEEKVYYLSVQRCKRTHPLVFNHLLRHGSKPGGFGPPCKDCRMATFRRVRGQEESKSTRRRVRKDIRSQQGRANLPRYNKWLEILGQK